MNNMHLSETNNTIEQPRMVPHAVKALIISIGGCNHGWTYGIPGIVMGIIGLYYCRQAEKSIYLSLKPYRGYNILSAAFRWSYISIIQGIVLSLLYLLVFIAMLF